jgi:hypothetical protein
VKSKFIEPPENQVIPSGIAVHFYEQRIAGGAFVTVWFNQVPDGPLFVFLLCAVTPHSEQQNKTCCENDGGFTDTNRAYTLQGAPPGLQS